MTNIKLSDTQRQILERAALNSDTRVTWFPDNLKGGARTKVLESLHTRGLIKPDPNGEGWCITGEGAEAVGMHCGASVEEIARGLAMQTESLAEMVKNDPTPHPRQQQAGGGDCLASESRRRHDHPDL